MAYAAYQQFMPPPAAVPFDPRVRTWQDWSFEDTRGAPDLASEDAEADLLARPVADLFPDPDGGHPSFLPPPKAITAAAALDDGHRTPGKAQFKVGHDYLHWDNPKAARQQQPEAPDPVLYNFAVDWPGDIQDQWSEIALNPTTHSLVPHQAPLAYTPAHKMPLAPSVAYASGNGNAMYDAPPALLPSAQPYAGALPPLEANFAPEMALALVPAAPEPKPYVYVNNINKPSIPRPPSAPPALSPAPAPMPQGAATTTAAIAAASGRGMPAPLPPSKSPFPVTTAPLYQHATPMPAYAPQPTPGKENSKPKQQAQHQHQQQQKPLKSALARTPFMDPADQLAWSAAGPYPAQITPGSGRRRGASFSSSYPAPAAQQMPAYAAQTGNLPMHTPYISPSSGRAHMAPTAQLEHMATQVAEQRGPGAINFAQAAPLGMHGFSQYQYYPSPTMPQAPHMDPPSATSKVKSLFGLGSGGGGNKDKRKSAPAPPLEADPLFGGVPVAKDSWYQHSTASQRTPSLAEQKRMMESMAAQEAAHQKALAQAAKVHGSGKKTGKIGTTPLPAAPTHFGYDMGMADLTDAYSTGMGISTHKSASRRKR